MKYGLQISNLDQITTRKHSDLQDLIAPYDDHTQYGLTVGLDANKGTNYLNDRFYYATDTDILYRGTGSAWSNIATGGGNITATLNKTFTFASLSDNPGAYSSNAGFILSVNAGGTALSWIAAPQPSLVYYNGGGTYYAETSTYTNITSTTPTLVRTMTLPAGFPSGTITVQFNLQNASSYSGYADAQIYKNGVAQGSVIQQAGPGSGFQGKVVSLTATAGDLIQLYCWADASGNQSQAQNMGLSGTLTPGKFTPTFS